MEERELTNFIFFNSTGYIITASTNSKGICSFPVNHSETLNEKMKDGGAFASFKQDSSYGIKNAPFDMYVRDKIDQQDRMKVTSKENGTIDNETAVRILGDGINSFHSMALNLCNIWYGTTINHMS